MKENTWNVVIKIVPIIVFLLFWQLLSNSGIVNDKLFPPPTKVWTALVQWASSGELWTDLKASYWRVLIGFILGGVLGIVMGMLMGRNTLFNQLFNILIQIFRPLPPVATIPLIIVWFGIGNIAKIISIAFAVFFPVWINTYLGSSNIPASYLWSAKLLTNNKWKIFFKVTLPATLPAIIVGLRTSISVSFVMLYVSELAGASEGVGYQISVSYLAYSIDKMMASLMVLALAGALADYLFAYIVDKIFPWIEINKSK